MSDARTPQVTPAGGGGRHTRTTAPGVPQSAPRPARPLPRQKTPPPGASRAQHARLEAVRPNTAPPGVLGGARFPQICPRRCSVPRRLPPGWKRPRRPQRDRRSRRRGPGLPRHRLRFHAGTARPLPRSSEASLSPLPPDRPGGASHPAQRSDPTRGSRRTTPTQRRAAPLDAAAPPPPRASSLHHGYRVPAAPADPAPHCTGAPPAPSAACLPSAPRSLRRLVRDVRCCGDPPPAPTASAVAAAVPAPVPAGGRCSAAAPPSHASSGAASPARAAPHPRSPDRARPPPPRSGSPWDTEAVAISRTGQAPFLPAPRPTAAAHGERGAVATSPQRDNQVCWGSRGAPQILTAAC